MKKSDRKSVCMAALSFILIVELIIKLIAKEKCYDIFMIYAFVECVNSLYLYSVNKRKEDLWAGVGAAIAFLSLIILYIGTLI